MARPSPVINVMTATARKAARELVRDFGEVEQLQVSRKGPADFVSAADLRAEKTIFRELSKARPGYGFLMEEGSGASTEGDGRHRWIVDPLDGTTNFLHGVPHFAISIALEVEGEIVAGVVHQPLTDETYWAERGQGAHLNDRRLRVSSRAKLEDALIGTGIPFKGEEGHGHYLATLSKITPLVSGAGSGLACGSNLLCSALTGAGGKAAAAAASSEGFPDAAERLAGMAARPGSAEAMVLLNWPGSGWREAGSASATSTLASPGLRSLIEATMRLVAPLSRFSASRLRMMASREPPLRPPSTTPTMWRLPRRIDVTRLKPEARV